MNDITQIKNELLHAAPGMILRIDGYRDSSGSVRDISVELLDRTAYADMQEADLELLKNANIDMLFGGAGGDLQLVDYIAARDQLIEARQKALNTRQEGGAAYKGAEYVEIGSGSLAQLPGDDGSLYLQRLKLRGAIEEPKPAKGAIPRAKQQLAQRLRLPTRRYVHTLKLADGKFDDLRITRMSRREDS